MSYLFEWTPKFVRRYASLRETIDKAVAHYAEDVRSGHFPGDAEIYTLRALMETRPAPLA